MTRRVRTTDEILFRIEVIKERDWLDIQTEELVRQLPVGYPHHLLDYFFTPAENASRVPLTDEEIHECILSNMEKAWTLANSGKDASLEGLLHKYEAWMWLLGDYIGPLTEFNDHGKDNLAKICKKYWINYGCWERGDMNKADEAERVSGKDGLYGAIAAIAASADSEIGCLKSQISEIVSKLSGLSYAWRRYNPGEKSPTQTLTTCAEDIERVIEEIKANNK